VSTRAVLGLALVPVACRPSASGPEIPLPSLAGVELEVAEAINQARAAVLREPDSSKAWGDLGDHYFVHNFLAHAAQCYSRAAELDPESFLWPYRLGYSLIKNHPELALPAFERSLASLQSYAPAHEIYASALDRLGRTDEAIEHYRLASQLDAKRPVADTSLGRIALARRDFETARTHLEEALARDGRHVEAHVALAQVYQVLGKEKKAQHHADLSRALPKARPLVDNIATPDLPPLGSRARTRYGNRLEREGKLEEASAQYRAALRSNPAYYLARTSLVNLLVEQGLKDEAIELLREAERQNPAFERVRRDIAALLTSGERLEAPEEME
jgi:tetratricopeptide (TPR) repeat protein